jgi:hypothetical protein
MSGPGVGQDRMGKREKEIERERDIHRHTYGQTN